MREKRFCNKDTTVERRNHYVLLLSYIIWATLFSFTHMGYGETHDISLLDQEPIILHDNQCRDTFKPTHIKKLPGHYNSRDWQPIIDSVWGPGLPTEIKLQIFDQFWSTLDSNFACFNNLIVNWDSLRMVYRAEIEDTVSRGRFAAIMNYLSLALMEAHTVAEDGWVNWSTSLSPGVPLFAIGAWLDNGHFGAGLTPLPDSSLLVYSVVPEHPLTLQRGDIVLGYDGIPWKILYKELMEAQLPYHRFGCWGSSESTLTHSLLMSAGLNWHLFDTIDVVKYSTGDTMHLATSALAGQSMSLYCTEQVDIPGVPMPDLSDSQAVSYGIVSGTQIGYIYGWLWWYDAENEFYEALYNLTNDPTVKGLIIDFRFNMGGNMFMSNKGLQLLFRDSVETICFTMRSDPHNHFAMYVTVPSSVYIIPGNGVAWYSKPIAVLTGPGAVSSGDQVAFRMTFHPMVKTFGKSTNTAFDAPTPLDIHTDWNTHYAYAEACLASDTTFFLTHRGFDVDFPIWLTQEDVAQGDDTVVRAAMAWIDSLGIHESNNSGIQSEIVALQIYPNPINDAATIEITLTKPNIVSAKIYNIAGQEIATVLSQSLNAGFHRYLWDTAHISSGIYFLQVTSGNSSQLRKITIIK